MEQNNNEPVRLPGRGLKAASLRVLEELRLHKEERDKRMAKRDDMENKRREEDKKKEEEEVRAAEEQKKFIENNRYVARPLCIDPAENLTPSQRVEEAARSHERLLEDLDNVISMRPINRLLNKPVVQSENRLSEQKNLELIEKKPEATNIFGQNTQNNIQKNILPGSQTNNIFANNGSNNIFAPKPSTNIFTQISTIKEVNESQAIEASEIEKKSLPEKPIIQEEKKEESKKAINIFAEGLFEENSEKSKPVLIFNNASVQPQNEKTEKKETPGGESQPAIKLLFNNNGAVVENIKPKINIFSGSEPIEEKEEELMIKPPVPEAENKLEPAKPSIFTTQKMEIQTPGQNNLFSNQGSAIKIEPPKQNLFSIQQSNNASTIEATSRSSLFTNEKPSLFANQNQQTPSLFSNETQQKNTLFSNQTQQTPLLFSNQNQQTPSLFSNETQQKTSLFSSQTEKSNLFNNPTSQPTTINNEKKNLFTIQEESISNASQNPNKSLFESNNSSNLFSKPEVKQNMPTNIFARKEDKKSEQEIEVKGENKEQISLFTSQNTNLFGNKLSSPEKKPQENIFATNQGNNIFGQPRQEISLFGKANNDNKGEELKTPVTKGNNLFQRPLEGGNMFAQSQQQEIGVSNNIFSRPLESGPNIFAQQASGLFAIRPNTQAASMFSQQNEDNQEGEGGESEGEEEDAEGLVKSDLPEGKEDMKYNNYEETEILAKLPCIKFKVARENDKLYENSIFSIEKFKENNNIYIIVRNPNKTPKFYGILCHASSLKINKDKDGEVSISIKQILQIDILNSNKKSFEEWRIMFKKSDQSTKFIQEVEKIMENEKKKQPKPN